VQPDLILVLIVVAVAALLFASGKVRLDVVALLVILSLAVSGVLSPREAVAGFGAPVVIIVAALLVIGRALTQTGVAHGIGLWLNRAGGGSETRLLVLLMISAAVLGSVMSSTAVVAILIPVVLRVASKTGTNPARLLLPLSFAALISGMLTLIASTPNLVVSAELSSMGYDPLNFFDFTPIGLGVLSVGILYMLIFGRRLLAGRSTEEPPSRPLMVRELVAEFGLPPARMLLTVPPSSQLIGQRLEDIDSTEPHEFRVLGVERTERFGRTTYGTPEPDFVLRANDALLIWAESDEV
jgi:di/tricarboxylate transporter